MQSPKTSKIGAIDTLSPTPAHVQPHPRLTFFTIRTHPLVFRPKPSINILGY